MANLQPVPLKVALHGMDARSQKTMALYLKGPCRGTGIVVEDADADVNLIDADFPAAGEILQTCQSRHPDRPVVLLSLQPLQINGTDFVQKPVNAERLMAVLNKFKALTNALSQPQYAVEAKEKTGDEVIKPPVQAKKRVLYEGNEGGYARFLGLLPGVEFNNVEQIVKAGFDPKLYYLNYVLSACKVTCRENRALQLRSIWKPLLIFPDTRQVWLDADDKQLRAFAGVEQAKGFAASIGLSPLDESVRGSLAPDKFQALEVFVWKLAIWTSKGRFPLFLPPEQPVYLKHWPNFTRLLLLPDALRIASLLIRDARAAGNNRYFRGKATACFCLYQRLPQSWFVRGGRAAACPIGCRTAAGSEQKTRSFEQNFTPAARGLIPSQIMSQYKIIFTGPVGAGKTTAISSISDAPPVKTDAAASDMTKNRKASTTVAMDYGVMNLDGGEKVHLWNPGSGAFRFHVGYFNQRRYWFGIAAR